MGGAKRSLIHACYVSRAKRDQGAEGDAELSGGNSSEGQALGTKISFCRYNVTKT